MNSQNNVIHILVYMSCKNHGKVELTVRRKKEVFYLFLFFCLFRAQDSKNFGEEKKKWFWPL